MTETPKHTPEGVDALIAELRARANALHSGEPSATATLCGKAADALDSYDKTMRRIIEDEAETLQSLSTPPAGDRVEATLLASHPEPERTAAAVGEGYAYLTRVHSVDGQMPAPALLVQTLTSRLERLAVRPQLLSAARADGPGGGEDLKSRVAEVVGEGDGFWRSRSGCYETEDGQNVHGYPHSRTFGCTLGGGCAECGGLGAIWDTTDYEDMARFVLAEAEPHA